VREGVEPRDSVGVGEVVEVRVVVEEGDGERVGEGVGVGRVVGVPVFENGRLEGV